VRPGERVADVVAVGDRATIAPGSRVDVLVTREAAGGTTGRTSLALEDVEVLAVAAAPAAGSGDAARAPRVRASLRVTLRQAVFLAAAQSFATEIRLLPRAAGDRRHAAAPLSVGSGL
jgi:pilus assembly protein CpaB